MQTINVGWKWADWANLENNPIPTIVVTYCLSPSVYSLVASSGSIHTVILSAGINSSETRILCNNEFLFWFILKIIPIWYQRTMANCSDFKPTQVRRTLPAQNEPTLYSIWKFTGVSSSDSSSDTTFIELNAFFIPKYIISWDAWSPTEYALVLCKNFCLENNLLWPNRICQFSQQCSSYQNYKFWLTLGHLSPPKILKLTKVLGLKLFLLN